MAEIIDTILYEDGSQDYYISDLKRAKFRRLINTYYGKLVKYWRPNQYNHELYAYFNNTVVGHHTSSKGLDRPSDPMLEEKGANAKIVLVPDLKEYSLNL